MIAFIKTHYIEFIIGFCLLVALLINLVCIIVKRIKRKNLDNLEKILENIPIIPVSKEDSATWQVEVQRGGDADLKWLRVQTFGDGVAVTSEEDEMAKEENKAKSTVKVTKVETSKLKKDDDVKKTAKKVVGKWLVREKGEDEFVAYLHANNGEIILTSEIYSTFEGAKKGIATIQKSAIGDNFQIYCDKNMNYYFKLKNSQNRFLCVGETYPTKGACLSAVESVKRFIESPVGDEVIKDLTQIVYVVPKNDKAEKKNGYTGKWVITDVDDMYIAQLFASNGELLLSSEAYTTAASAKSAIETITTNGIEGNFIIDADKKGRYFFKLRNSQKSTLCVGESYAQLSSCQSAIDSVRRFLRTAKLEVSSED